MICVCARTFYGIINALRLLYHKMQKNAINKQIFFKYPKKSRQAHWHSAGAAFVDGKNLL